jgi:hypothetical protein
MENSMVVFKTKSRPEVVTHACNPALCRLIQRILRLVETSLSYIVQGQSGLHRKTLSPKEQIKN